MAPSNIHTLRQAHRLRVVEQAPAGDYGFAVPAPARPRVDITPGMDGYRVWLDGRVWREFATWSNAVRCLSALRELEALGALPNSFETQPPQEAV